MNSLQIAAVASIISATLASAAWAAPQAPKQKKPDHQSTITSNHIVNDSWYTMQAGSTPFGIYHEIIEERDGKYSYKYSLTKYERGGEYQENIGALCQANETLTPIAFNLNKSGGGAVESTNATYAPHQSGGGIFNVEVQGARTDRFNRIVGKTTILDVFFPLWLRNNWSKLKPGYHGWLKTFAEDPERADFRDRMVTFEVKGQDQQNSCLKILVNMESIHAEWCMNSNAVLATLKVGGFHVKRVKSESEARAFVSGIAQKKK